MSTITEPTDRNQLVWDAWSAVYGDAERSRAQMQFPPDKFDCRQSVCYFSEHEAARTDENGQPSIRRYDVSELGAIMRENNFRIEDRDAYPTIIDRHTAPPNTPGAVEPKTLGGVGPIRLGMIGRKEPVFALFADEYTRKDARETLQDRPGRSVEVLTMRSSGKTYINPIAAISQAPRLPLPLQFSIEESQGGIVERYSMMAPTSVFPGGGNTYTQKFDNQSPDHSGGNSPQPENQAVDEQTMRQMVDAIVGQIQPMIAQEVQSQLGGAAGANVGGAPGGPPSPPPQHQPPQHQPPQHPPQGNYQRYDADGGEFELDDEVSYVTPEQYQAMRDNMLEMASAYDGQQQEIAMLQQDRADAVRREAIRDLHNRFPHAVDVEHELSQCLYSAGNDMSDDVFQDRMADREYYAAKAMPVTPMIPAGDRPQIYGGNVESSKYQAAEFAEVNRLMNQYANAGEIKPLAELKKEARQNLQQPA